MRSLFDLFGARSLENPSYPLTSTSLLEVLGGLPTDAGVNVTEVGSLAMSAVWRGTSLLGGLAGALPIHVYNRESKEPVTNLLLQNPHPDMTTYELWKLSQVHRCLWGNSYFQKIRDEGRRVRWLYPLAPWRMQCGKVRSEKITELNPTGKVFCYTDEDGVKHDLTPHEVFHVPGLGYDGICGVSPIRAAAQAVGTGLAAEKAAAKLFGSGNMLSGILQTEQRLTQEAAETLQSRWQSKMTGADRAHSVAVLDSGAEFQSLTMPADDAQMLESRDFQITELARYFGIPPYLMFQTEKSTSWGTGLEAQATGFVVFDLHPQWMAPLEARITKELLPSGHYAKYKLEGLLRGDTTARSEFYRTLRELGVLNSNDIRALEDLPPIQDSEGNEDPVGDLFLQPANFVPLGYIPPDPITGSTPKGNGGSKPAGGVVGGGGSDGPKKKPAPKKTGPKDGDGDGIVNE